METEKLKIGSALEINILVQPCEACKGSGKLTRPSPTSFVPETKKCEKCQGRGLAKE